MVHDGGTTREKPIVRAVAQEHDRVGQVEVVDAEAAPTLGDQRSAAGQAHGLQDLDSQGVWVGDDDGAEADVDGSGARVEEAFELGRGGVVGS